MIETTIMNALDGLATGGVYFDAAPQDTPRPYIVLLQVGGDAITFLDNSGTDDQVRISVDVSAASRIEANEIMVKVRAALQAPPLLGMPVGAPVSLYEAAVQTFRRICDFSFFSQA